MKKTIFIVAFLVSSMLTMAQIYTVKKGLVIDVNKLNLEYITVTGSLNITGTKIKYFTIDYGDKGVWADNITDKTGKVMKFTSIPVMLTYFYKNGWELNIIDRTPNNPAVIVYYMKRRNEDK